VEYQVISEFLKKNNLTNEKMDSIIEEVKKNNWKLKKILKDSGCHWSELQPALLRSAIKIYTELEKQV